MYINYNILDEESKLSPPPAATAAIAAAWLFIDYLFKKKEFDYKIINIYDFNHQKENKINTISSADSNLVASWAIFLGGALEWSSIFWVWWPSG